MFTQRSPIVVVQNAVSAIFGYVGLFFILRYIGTVNWGFVAFGVGFVGILSLVGDLGYSTAHTIKVSKGEDVGICNGTFLTVKLVLGVVFVALVILSLEVWTRLLHNGFQSPIEYWIIISLIPYYFFQNFTIFTTTYFRATLKAMRMSIPPTVEAILRNSIFVVLALVVHYSSGAVPAYREALLVSTTYSFTYSVYFMLAMFLGRPWNIKKPTREMLKSYTMLALPLMLVASVGSLSGNIDKVVIQFFWHAVPTGAFYTSQQIALVLTTLASSLTVFFLPLLVRFRHLHGKEAHNRSIFEFENLMSLYILPFVVILVVLAPYVLNIFTSGYLIYWSLLAILAIRAYFAAINTPYYSAIASRSMTRTIAKIDISTLLLNIALIVILVPPSIDGFSGLSLKWTGAAVAMLIVVIVSAIVYRIVVARLESIGYNLHPLRHIVPALSQVLFIIVIELFVVPKDILVLLPLAVVSLFVYFGAALMMRETSFETLISIIKGFDPRNLKQSFTDENVGEEITFDEESP